jgi:tRNA C32,U32 (ribose-2'-O)-methylase TrmJ
VNVNFGSKAINVYAYASLLTIFAHSHTKMENGKQQKTLSRQKIFEIMEQIAKIVAEQKKSRENDRKYDSLKRC